MLGRGWQRNLRLRQARSLTLALPLQDDALLEGQRLSRSIPRVIVVVGMVVVVGGFRWWCIAGLDRLTGGGVCLLPAADAGGDRFLGGGLLALDALQGGLDGVGGLQRLDPVSQLGHLRRLIAAGLVGSGRQGGLELVAQVGQFGQVLFVREGLAQALPVVA